MSFALNASSDVQNTDANTKCQMTMCYTSVCAAGEKPVEI